MRATVGSGGYGCLAALGGSLGDGRVDNAVSNMECRGGLFTIVTGLASARAPYQLPSTWPAFHPPLSVLLQATRFGARPTWGAAAALGAGLARP